MQLLLETMILGRSFRESPKECILFGSRILVIQQIYQEILRLVRMNIQYSLEILEVCI